MPYVMEPVRKGCPLPGFWVLDFPVLVLFSASETVREVTYLFSQYTMLLLVDLAFKLLQCNVKLSDCFHAILRPNQTKLESNMSSVTTLLCLTHVLSQRYGLFPSLSSESSNCWASSHML